MSYFKYPTQDFTITICLFFLLNLNLFAQQNFGKITGTLITSDAEKAVGVNIILKNSKYATISDENGVFEFNRIKPNVYTVQVSLTGYETIEKEVLITGNETTILNLQLNISNKELKEVVINYEKIAKFSRVSSINVAKIHLNKMENPQVYSSVSRELIQDQVIVTYSDIIKNVPGVNLQLQNNSSTPGGAVSARGFSGATFIRNGVPGMNVGILDPINIETLEVLKGPSGTLFGGGLNTSFGGTFNRVTKKPLDTFQAAIGYSGGSYELNRITADVNTPLKADKSLLFRVTAAKHYEGSFQDAGFLGYTFISPSLTYKINDHFTLNMEGEFMKGKYNTFYRFFVDGSNATGVHAPDQLNFDFNRHFYNNDIYLNGNTNSFYTQADYKISDTWKSVTNFSYSTTLGSGLAGWMTAKPGNIELVTTIGDTEYTRSTLANIQQNFIGNFEIAGMKHRLLIGLDYLYTAVSTSSSVLNFNTQNMADPGIDYGAVTRTAVLNRFSTASFNVSNAKNATYSTYVQDVVTITDQLIVLLALRADRFINEGTFNVITRATIGNFNQTAWSPRLGLVYQPIKDKISLFVNYMNGFSNVAPVTQPNGFVSIFEPQKANQLEGGVKLNLINGKLSGTLSYYDIKVKNVVRTDADNPGYTLQNGEQYSKGFEA